MEAKVHDQMVKRYFFSKRWQQVFPWVAGGMLVMLIVGKIINPDIKTDWQTGFNTAIGIATILTYIAVVSFFEPESNTVYKSLNDKLKRIDEKIEIIKGTVSEDFSNNTQEDLEKMLRIKKLEKRKMRIEWEIDLLTFKK